MTETHENKCHSCSHWKVCKLKYEYLDIANRLSMRDWIKPVDLECIHFEEREEEHHDCKE